MEVTKKDKDGIVWTATPALRWCSVPDNMLADGSGGYNNLEQLWVELNPDTSVKQSKWVVVPHAPEEIKEDAKPAIRPIVK